MFHDDQGVACGDELVQDGEKFLDVVEVQVGGGIAQPPFPWILISNGLAYIQTYNNCMRLEDVMGIKIGSYEAKIKFPELLRQVRAGKSFTITNRGEAIADLVPSAGMRAKDKVSAAAKLKAFMLADPVRSVDIKALIEEGRV